MNIPRACLAGAALGTMLAADGCVSAVKTSPQDDSAQASVYRGLVAASVAGDRKSYNDGDRH